MKIVKKKEALDTIKNGNFEERTNYFGYENLVTGKTGYVWYDHMKETLRASGFGEAESDFIVSAMVLAGAKMVKE